MEEMRVGRKCYMCGHEGMREERRTVPLKSFPDAFVGDVLARVCVECGEETIGFKRFSDMLDTFAKMVLLIPRDLKGKELRYLRKHAGWSEDQLAISLEVDVEQIKEWEKGNLRVENFLVREVLWDAQEFEEVGISRISIQPGDLKPYTYYAQFVDGYWEGMIYQDVS